MKNFITPLLAVLFATATFAAMPQPETQGSEPAQAAAEATHNARVHGIDNTAKQPQAQAADSKKSQDVAEAKHLKKSHGNVNNSADQHTQKDATRL
jgi:hypothetical protein